MTTPSAVEDDSSPPSSGPGVPPPAGDPASVRSLAIEKLKRAASLPRMKNGRRPQTPTIVPPEELTSPEPQLQVEATSTDWFEGGRNSIGPPPTFNDAYQPPTPPAEVRKRGRPEGAILPASFSTDEALPSFSASSSTSASTSLFRSASVSTQPSQQQQRFQLPSLQHIQTRHLLQRSNSAAARMNALHKLTGEPLPPAPPVAALAPPPIVFQPPSPIKATFGEEVEDHDPGMSPTDGRPRLRRSHTVGGGDGVERRSVVGRRMMMRLGNRVATPSPSSQSSSPSRTETEFVEASPQGMLASLSALTDVGGSRSLSPSSSQGTEHQEERLPQQSVVNIHADERFADDDDGQEANYPSTLHPTIPSSANTFGHPQTPFELPLDSTTADEPEDDTHERLELLQYPPSLALETDETEDLLPSQPSPTRHAHFLPSPPLQESFSHEPRLSRASSTSTSTHSVPSSMDHGLLGPGDNTDSFEFAEHLRRTNSGRTVRTVSPFPPGHPGRSSTEEHRATPPPLPSSPPILTRGANTPGLASTSPYTSFNTSSPVDHRPRTPPRQISDALSSSTQSTPTAFSEVSTSSTASPGSIPILPPSDEGHGTHAFGSFSSTGDRGFSTSSFPASVSGGEMLGRSTGEWASGHTDRASGEDEDGSGGAEYEARAEEGEGDATPLPDRHEFAPQTVFPDTPSLKRPSATPAQSYQAQVEQSAAASITESARVSRGSVSRGSTPPSQSKISGLLRIEVPQKDERASVMSWEEVGGFEDREVPVDGKYQKKSDSLSGKLQSLVAKGVRSRSGSTSHPSSPLAPNTNTSRSSARTSPVQMTRELSALGQGRSLSKTTSRSSGSSVERRRGSAVDGSGAGPSAFSEVGSAEMSRHGRGSSQSSINFAPSSPAIFASSPGGPISPLPPAVSTDPKYQDAKLMPFPGIVRLEQERNRIRGASISAGSSPNPNADVHSRQPPPSDALGLPQPAPSFSSSAFSSPAPGSEHSPNGPQSYFDLPPRAPSPPLGVGSSGKKSWLAKKFSVSGKGSPSGEKIKRRPSLGEVFGGKKGSETSLETPFYTPLSPSMFPSHQSMASVDSSVVGNPSSRSTSMQDLRRNSNQNPSSAGGLLSSRPSDASIQSSLREPSRSPVIATRSLPSAPLSSLETTPMPPSPPSPTVSNSARFESAMSPPRVSTVQEVTEAEEHTPKRGRLPSLVNSASSIGAGAASRRSEASPTPNSSRLPTEREMEEYDASSLRSIRVRHPEEEEEPATRSSVGQEESTKSESRRPSPDQRIEEEQESRGEYASSVEEDLAADSPAHSRHASVDPGAPAPQFPPKTSQVLGRLDSLLATGAGQPTRPSQLDNTPRKLLLFVPVLQVVNNNTVKDRFLFLFTDLLLIAKPILPEGHLPSLETKFIVKSVVELHKLKLSGLKDDDGSSDSTKRQHPVVVSFIEMFSQKTEEAMDLLTHKSNLEGDNIASLLFKTPELDKARLGEFFSSSANLPLLKGFVARFPFGGVRIDEALRIFLLAMRLPSETTASDVLLKGFANAWHASNASVVTFDRDLVLRLVMAMMQLNDYLNPSNSGFGNFAFANTSITAEDFIQAFQERDQARHIDDDLLRSIYVSIKSDRLSQALSASDISLERDIYILPTRIATRLTYKVQSEPMFVNIPDPDRDFSIRMHGAGLKFDPPVLTFANSSQATFRVTGTSLGQKTILFSRTGLNAALYPGLAPTKVFFVERAFMKVGHTLQVAFVREPTTTKRKYLYSFEDADARQQWANTLQSQISRCVSSRSGQPAPGPVSPQVLAAAEAVALQVLRDALIPADDDSNGTNATNGSPDLGNLPRNGSHFNRNPRANSYVPSSANRNPSHPSTAVVSLARSASSSVVYGMRAGRGEKDLDSQLERERERSKASSQHGGGGSAVGARGPFAGGRAKVDPSRAVAELEQIAATPFLQAQTGREIAILCEQNSLIPLVLSFLSAGTGPQDTQRRVASPSPPSHGLGFRNGPSSAPLGKGFF